MTYDEAIHAMLCLPLQAEARMQAAADDAERFWTRQRCTRAQLRAAKAVALEVSLIASGALLHIAKMR